MTDGVENSRMDAEKFGRHLRLLRQTAGLTLRDVEAATEKGVTNGYLSQIENGDVVQPSPRVLHHLSTVYGVDYADLMLRAGHHVPVSQGVSSMSLNGFPVQAILDLSPEQQQELLRYVEFIKNRS
jgi:transcriptional regulator with XRE-family HTH domain